MNLEIERKYLHPCLSDVRQRLENFGAVSGGVHFESNVVFDTVDHALVARGELLRLRSQQWPGKKACRLTYKAPVAEAAGEDRFKTREELELALDDCGIMAMILPRLGFGPVAHYEKFREAWILHLSLRNEDGRQASVNVDLDILPFCEAVEIEGEPAAIDAAALLLGLDKLETSIKSYHYLHTAWRREKGLMPALDFVFPKARRHALMLQFGIAAD